MSPVSLLATLCATDRGWLCPLPAAGRDHSCGCWSVCREAVGERAQTTAARVIRARLCL